MAELDIAAIRARAETATEGRLTRERENELGEAYYECEFCDGSGWGEDIIHHDPDCIVPLATEDIPALLARVDALTAAAAAVLAFKEEDAAWPDNMNGAYFTEEYQAALAALAALLAPPA